MNIKSEHTFHIPVMGISYTIDTPIKVGRFGVSSVLSLGNDKLIEELRKFYCNNYKKKYEPINDDVVDRRALRITSYLNLLKNILDEQIATIKNEPFKAGYDIVKYYNQLPVNSKGKYLYDLMVSSNTKEKHQLQKKLRKLIVSGSIDVNIMTKLDKVNYNKKNEPLPKEYQDAMSALRGYANSALNSSLVFSAGFNPKLYTYIEKFPDFFPNSSGEIKKRIIIKVSDFRSAKIQAMFLAKKGIWVSEFRIESGINCGGHSFPTNGVLIGPILEEFKKKKRLLIKELFESCNAALAKKSYPLLQSDSSIRITYQGGIGTSKEDEFLREYYDLDSTGWGSPFMLVPEATNLDDKSLNNLANAQKEDYYLSYASPLGIPYNNFRKSSSEEQRKRRIEDNKPGSPCPLKHLAFNTDFTQLPVCTASRKYQKLKLEELSRKNLSKDEYLKEYDAITEKDCLCDGLSTSVMLKNNLPVQHKTTAVNLCPGPNLAYFSSVYSLQEMISHIYGRTDLLNFLERRHILVNELILYFDFLKNDVQKRLDVLTEKQKKYYSSFISNLLEGVAYYKNIIHEIAGKSERKGNEIFESLNKIEIEVKEFFLKEKKLQSISV